MGATFQGEIATWNHPGSSIVLTEMVDADTSGLTILNPATAKANHRSDQVKANSDF
jgi:hypothetical protein